MDTNMFQEADANEFDSELISSRIAASKQETILKLKRKLANLISAAEAGKTTPAAQIADLQNKISALETPSASLSVDLPSGLEVDPPIPVPVQESIFLHPTHPVKSSIWTRLFDHQKQALRWLSNLHQTAQGGILADEMGLGKTVEVAAFLSSLKDSGLMYGPVLVLCPATIVMHWKGCMETWGDDWKLKVLDDKGKRASTIRAVKRDNGVLVTNYEVLYTHEDLFRTVDWFYVILDEGHKIRNPHSKVTEICKRLRTSHRLLLSGTPIQNNLSEFWSLVDFVCPGLLGTLETFEKEFAAPILRAGYVSADAGAVELGYQCACQLRDLIAPFILRRTKKELRLNLGLPEKEEKLLFCDMTETQFDCYTNYLDKYAKDLHNKKDAFVCIRDLRHITNHPMILAAWKQTELSMADTHFLDSGKISVLAELLPAWALEAHKTAIFSQSKRMLTICESLVQSLNLPYARIDGDLPIGARLPIIEAFNTSERYRILLLTTKVGGLGLSLTGASKLVILDPDWNPMTDIQAKERALRIGQDKTVGIYRFITRDTIEEKVYRRQVFKVFLANRILHSPEQKKFFTSHDVNELFEYPSRAKRRAQFHEEDAPAKQRKTDENLILTSLLDADGIKREDLSNSMSLDPENIQETTRVRAHAESLAQKARNILVKSRALQYNRVSPASVLRIRPSIVRFGTFQAQEILTRVRGNQCEKKKTTAAVTVEELTVKRLYQFFNENDGKASSKAIIAHINLKLRDFDAYLVKAVLRSIATLQNGIWTLRPQFCD